MATDISDFRPFVRTILNDDNEDGLYTYSDYQIDNAVKLVVGLGQVPGYSISGETVTPTLDMDTNYADYALLVFKVAKRFGVAKTDFATSSRGVSVRVGRSENLVADILNTIADLESGEGCR